MNIGIVNDLPLAVEALRRVIALRTNPTETHPSLAAMIDVPIDHPRDALGVKEHPQFLRLRRACQPLPAPLVPDGAAVVAYARFGWLQARRVRVMDALEAPAIVTAVVGQVGCLVRSGHGELRLGCHRFPADDSATPSR